MIIADIEPVLDVVVAVAGGGRGRGAALPRILLSEICGSSRIRQMLSGYRQADIDLMMPALMFGCSMLVGANWPKIEALAEALLANGVVKRPEIMRLLGRRTRPPRETVMMVAWLLAGASSQAARACARCSHDLGEPAHSRDVEGAFDILALEGEDLRVLALLPAHVYRVWGRDALFLLRLDQAE